MGAFTHDGSPVAPETCPLCKGRRIVYETKTWSAIPEKDLQEPCLVRDEDGPPLSHGHSH